MGPHICMTSSFSDTPLNFQNPEIRNQIISANLPKSIVLPNPLLAFTISG